MHLNNISAGNNSELESKNVDRQLGKIPNCHLEAERYERGQDGSEMPTLLISGLAYSSQGAKSVVQQN